MRLEVRELTVELGGCRILSEVGGSAEAGDVVGLVGPNGAGKSTLANVICGLLRPARGLVLFNDVDLTRLDPHRIGQLGVSRLFQGQHLAWNLTVEENLLAAAEAVRGVSWGREIGRLLGFVRPDPTLSDRVGALLERTGLSAARCMPARDLSFGQQRLLALACALIREPHVLVLDEPFTGLKSDVLERVAGILREQAGGKILLVIEHSLGPLRSIASRFWYLNRGHLTVYEDFAQMESSALFVRSYLGLTSQRASSSLQPQIDSRFIASTQTSRQLFKGAHDVPTPGNATLGGPVRGGEPLLSVRDLSAGYGRNMIIHKVSFDLWPGEVLCIIGRNGCGKSTLLRAIMGAVPNATGSVFLEGTVLDRLSPDVRVRRGLRLLPQDARVFRTLSVTDNLLLSQASLSTPRLSRAGLPLRRPHLAMPTIAAGDAAPGCSNFALIPSNRPAGLLSGGEQARLALSEVQRGSPKVIMLDEPTAGVDGIARQELSQFLREASAAGSAFLIVEHDLDFVLALATKVAKLHDGQLQFLETRTNGALSQLREAFK